MKQSTNQNQTNNQCRPQGNQTKTKQAISAVQGQSSPNLVWNIIILTKTLTKPRVMLGQNMCGLI